jgi:hypothetical protein
MPPDIIHSTTGHSVKAGFEYINCDQPTGSTLDTAGNIAGMIFADLPGQTNVTKGSPVDGMEYDIRDGLATNCADGTCTTFGTNVTGGGGSLHLRVRYNQAKANWTLCGV